MSLPQARSVLQLFKDFFRTCHQPVQSPRHGWTLFGPRRLPGVWNLCMLQPGAVWRTLLPVRQDTVSTIWRLPLQWYKEIVIAFHIHHTSRGMMEVEVDGYFLLAKQIRDCIFYILFILELSHVDSFFLFFLLFSLHMIFFPLLSDRGSCIMEKCACTDGWEGDACECPKSNQTCLDSRGVSKPRLLLIHMSVFMPPQVQSQ